MLVAFLMLKKCRHRQQQRKRRHKFWVKDFMTDSINASSNSLHARNDADATILYVAISIASNSVMPSFKSCYWVQSCVGCVKNRTGSILELKHHLPCLRCVRCVYSLFACVVFLCCLRCLRSFFNARVCVACVALGGNRP